MIPQEGHNAVDGLTVASLLGRHALIRPGQPAICDPRRRLSYGQLHETVQEVATGLQSRGLRAGEPVAILMGNRVEWLVYFFAIMVAGGIVVPLTFYTTPAELDAILRDAGVRWLVTEPSLIDVTPKGGPWQILLATEELARGAGGDVSGERLTRDDHDVALVQYTSGTSGRPKAIEHSYTSILWNTLYQLYDLQIDRSATTLVVPSLAWGAGLHDLTLPTLWAGGRVVLYPSRALAADRLLGTLASERITHTFISPSVLRRLVDIPDTPRPKLDSLRVVLTGGEPLELSLLRQVTEHLGRIPLRPSYGLSEFPSTMTLMPPEEVWRRPTSVGQATSLADIRIVDHQGRVVAAGVTGELVCRSPAVMVGYRNDPEASAEALRDGWLHTGDLATRDADGFVTIVGRIKDMLISGGLNVYCAEVEQALLAHEAVREAAVIGVPDSQWGQVPCAHVVLEFGREASTAQLDSFLQERLAGYKRPKHYVIHASAMPRNTAGKIIKSALFSTDIDNDALASRSIGPP